MCDFASLLLWMIWIQTSEKRLTFFPVIRTVGQVWNLMFYSDAETCDGAENRILADDPSCFRVLYWLQSSFLSVDILNSLTIRDQVKAPRLNTHSYSRSIKLRNDIVPAQSWAPNQLSLLIQLPMEINCGRVLFPKIIHIIDQKTATISCQS